MKVYQNLFTRSQRYPKTHQKACCRNVNRKNWDTLKIFCKDNDHFEDDKIKISD